MALGITEKLCTFIVNTNFKDIPEPAIDRAKIAFLDIIGVALAGTIVGETGKIAIKYAKDVGGIPEATIIGGRLLTSAPNAALVNGLLSHALDFDDWEPSGHPSGMLVTTALALGEKLDLPGRDVLAAYILGLELYERLALGHPDIIERGWHGTAIYGTLGSAATAAKLLGLNVQQTTMALGIAASAAGGIIREHGTMTKPYQVGKAARNGVEAALLARDGFTGDGAIIENPGGLCDCFLGQGACDYSKMIQNLGNPFHIISPGLGIKPYPCGGIKFFRCIEGVLTLKKKHSLTYDDVDSVEVRMSERQNRKSIEEPETGLQGKFSTRYLCARSLLDGKLTLETFTDAKVKEPVIKEALNRIHIIEDETIPNDWTTTWSTVTIKLKDGRILSKQVDIPQGDQRNPLPIDSVVQKYHDNASLLLSEGQIEHARNLILNLDQVEHLQELMNILKRGERAS